MCGTLSSLSMNNAAARSLFHCRLRLRGSQIWEFIANITPPLEKKNDTRSSSDQMIYWSEDVLWNHWLSWTNKEVVLCDFFGYSTSSFSIIGLKITIWRCFVVWVVFDLFSYSHIDISEDYGASEVLKNEHFLTCAGKIILFFLSCVHKIILRHNTTFI